MFQEFPKWKYHDEHEAVIVEDADAEMALGDGWRDTVLAEVKEEAGIDALRAELDDKGIAYDKRWGVKRLKSELNK